MSTLNTYYLASKVRSKLTKDAANPNVSLRNLVTQANMLDELMDSISNESSKRLDKLNNNKVTFDVSQSQKPHNRSTNVEELELNEESDEYESESDDDSYYYSSSSDDDLYDSDDEDNEADNEDEETEIHFHLIPKIQLNTIEEQTEDENEEEDLPELFKTSSATDSEESEGEYEYSTFPSPIVKDISQKPRNFNHYNLLTSRKLDHTHHRSDAVTTINDMF